MLRTRKVCLKMESCSFSVSANRIVENAWASNKPLKVVNITTQEVHPDGKYDLYFPVRPLDIRFLIHRVHSIFFININTISLLKAHEVLVTQLY